MEKKNIYIKQQNHTKLYILPKDQIDFESNLKEHNIPFYSDQNIQPYTDTGIRYFVLDSDRYKIDQLLKDKKIIASTETIPSYDYRDQKKIGTISIIVFSIVIILTLIILYL